MDPNKSTRREYAEYAKNSFSVPDGAAPQWKQYGNNLSELAYKLAFHDAMKPNIDQTYMTPAASKNKVYFMWDFFGRTLSMLSGVPPTLQNMSPQQKEAWTDVASRSEMAKGLILDTNAGMLDMMVSSTYPNQSGPSPAFGEEILAIARQL